MAVLIPEAAEAVAGGEAAVSGASATTAARPAAGSLPRMRSNAARNQAAGLPAPTRTDNRPVRVRPSSRPPAAAGPAPAKPKKPQAAAKDKSQGKSKRKGGVLASGGSGRRKSIGAGRYQPVILAEFLVAVLVISIPPLAKGGDPTAQAKGSPSPYSTDTLKQLIAAGAVYFILALLSGSQKLGRYAAWFGGLTLLGIGLLQTANGDLTALFKIFGPSSGAAGEPSAADQAAIGQAVSGALGGALGTGDTVTVPNPDATGLFPTVEPGGQIVTSSVITPPPGGTGVTTTTGSDAGANLA